jgi:hypothetical protein
VGAGPERSVAIAGVLRDLDLVIQQLLEQRRCFRMVLPDSMEISCIARCRTLLTISVNRAAIFE